MGKCLSAAADGAAAQGAGGALRRAVSARDYWG